MRKLNTSLFLTLTALTILTLQFHADAAPAGPLIKHLSSFLKWTRSSTKLPQTDGNILQFESGYIVETVVQGNDLGVIPYKIRVSEDGELFAVDAENSNIVKITPPLSQYSRARLVAGSFQGHKGHVDGKPADARFSHPKGVTMDDKGNVYVADTTNLAIRKIGDAGVTTIAGGKSNIPGFRDGPSEDAKFSSDFDVVYVRPTCSLLVVDRGNAALRQISLNEDDCEYQYSSISSTDIILFVGAIVVGYATCMLQQGFGPVFSSKRQQLSEIEYKAQSGEEKPVPIVESMKEEPGWPSFGQLILDLSKFALEALGNMFTYLVPLRFRPAGFRNGLRPLKDRLIMPEDEAETPFKRAASRKGITPLKDSLRMPGDEAEQPSLHKQSIPAPVPETRVANNHSDKYTDVKPIKLKSMSFKDPSLSSKHRSSRRQEYAEFYGSSEVPDSRSKSKKEKPRRRQRDATEGVLSAQPKPEGVCNAQPKPVELKPVDYETLKFDHYNYRHRYGPDGSYRF